MNGDDPFPAEGVIRKTRRHLPHWDLAGSTYFVTFRVALGELAPEVRGLVLDHVRRGSDVFYRLIAAVVMPDHVHLIFRPRAD